jgi:NAD(P)H dehydrogenase (quinone)
MATNVLIAFYSSGGAVEALANAVAEGARGESAEVRLRRARELAGIDVMARAPGWSDKSARQSLRATQ